MATVAVATARPVAPSGKKSPRARWLLALALVFTALSVGGWLFSLRADWEMYWHQVDLQVYMWGGEAAAKHPTQLYVDRGPMFLPFLYPVFAAWICAELARFPINYIGTAAVVATLVSLYVSVWCTAVLLRYRRGIGLLAVTLAVGSAVLWLEPVQQTFRFGQVSVILLAIVLGDLVIPKDRWYRGILIGIATGVKLTPAVFIVHMVLTRQYRAAAVAVGSFAATVAIGFWYLPSQAWQFWTTTASAQNRIGFAYVQNQSINGVFGRLQWTTWDNDKPWLICAGALGLAGLVAARSAHRRGDELLGILLAAGVTLLCSPISWTHYWVWIVPAMMWAVHAMRHRSLPARWGGPVVIGLFTFAWPMKIDEFGAWDPDLPLLPQGLLWYVPHTAGREYHWTWPQFLLGNSYALLTLAAMLAAMYYLRPGRDRSYRAEQSLEPLEPRLPTVRGSHVVMVGARYCGAEHPPEPGEATGISDSDTALTCSGRRVRVGSEPRSTIRRDDPP